MPETSDIPVTTAQLTASLAALTVGPYADASTAAAADLAAETVRYLNHAAAKGGITDPATVSDLTGSLAATAYRLPQLLNTISEWLRAETAAGRIAWWVFVGDVLGTAVPAALRSKISDRRAGSFASR